jgi:hypothetical protein
MIIKSLSRQNKSFKALYSYLTRDKDSLLRGFNLYANPYNKKELVKEFLDNANYLRKSRGKNYYYHEIISLDINTLNSEKQIAILNDIANKYISLRAENHLTFSALHTDKEHIHMHLMISANEYMGTKRVRLSKKDFSTIQKEIETYLHTIYPELGKTKLYNKNFEKIRSKKQELCFRLDELFKHSSSKDLFEKKRQKLELEFYTRGKTTGVIFDGKKYRLKTLEKLEKYEKIQTTFEKEKTAPLNENEAKIKARKEAMKKARESRYQESKER